MVCGGSFQIQESTARLLRRYTCVRHATGSRGPLPSAELWSLGKGPMDRAKCVEFWRSETDARKEFPKWIPLKISSFRRRHPKPNAQIGTNSSRAVRP